MLCSVCFSAFEHCVSDYVFFEVIGTSWCQPIEELFNYHYHIVDITSCSLVVSEVH